MSNSLFQQLEDKVGQTLLLITTLKQQLQASEQENKKLQSEIQNLRSRQEKWEQGLSTLLRKLDSNDIDNLKSLENLEEYEDREEEEEEMEQDLEHSY